MAALPAPEVALVDLVDHVIVDADILQFILTPVPRVGPITFVELGDTVVEFFGESLEVLEVLEGICRRHIAVGRLVEIVSAAGLRECQREHGTHCSNI